MFKHVFATMQDILHDIMIHYPHANDTERKRLDEQLAKLKHFSDQFIEEWLQFEERMADFRDLQQQSFKPKTEIPNTAQPQSQAQAKAAVGYPKVISAVPKAAPKPTNAGSEISGEREAAEELCQAMSKGQGYFKLFMFRDAAKHFQAAVSLSPDDNQARLFLGMTFMHLQEWQEAQRHFQLLVEVTEHPKWRALGLNALGCIQAVRMNLEQAAAYFARAHEADPNFTDPLANMKSCEQHAGQLSLYFGSGQL